MTTKTRDRIVRGVRTSPRGYARDYSCHLQHSGNTGYMHHSGDAWQCQGCGMFVGTQTILARTACAEALEARDQAEGGAA